MKNDLITFLDLACGVRKGVEYSKERFNHICSHAAQLAIGAGFVFDLETVKYKVGRGYYATSIFANESLYSLAVAEGNTSFCQAYEEWTGREPIIADEVTTSRVQFAHMAGYRQKERLHVGCSFMWQGERVTVTSFNKDGAAIAVEYQHDADSMYYGKVKRRHTITREKVIQHRAEQKEREEIGGKLSKLKNVNVMKKLGIKMISEFNAIPIKTLRKKSALLLSDAAMAA